MLIGGGSLIILVTLLLTVGLGTSAEFMVVIGASSSSVYVSDPTGPALPRVSYPINLRVVVVLMGIGPVYNVFDDEGVSPLVV